MMDGIVALTPMAQTTAWSIAINQGHVAASPGFKLGDLDFINATVRGFMADVTRNWTTIR